MNFEKLNQTNLKSLEPPMPACLFRASFDWSSFRSGRNSSCPGTSGCCRRSGSGAGCWRPRSRSRKSYRPAGRPGSARRFVGPALAERERLLGSSRNRGNLFLTEMKRKFEFNAFVLKIAVN